MISAGLSIVSITLGSVQKLNAEKNNCLSWKGQAVQVMFANLVLFARFFAIVIFFAPSLGLFNLLMHWKFGQIEAAERHIFDVINGTMVAFKSVWVQTPDYSTYTFFYLHSFFKAFLVFILFHLILIFALKVKLAISYNSKDRIAEKCFHLLTQIFIPSIFADWDDEESSGMNSSQNVITPSINELMLIPFI